MLVIDEYEYDLQVLDDDARPGYAWLKINRGEQSYPELNKVLKYWNFFGYFFADDLYVDPGKTIEIFYSELQKVIDKSIMMKGRVKLRRHGLAIAMDVHPYTGVLCPRLYSVDLFPAYQVGGGLYVSQSFKEDVPNRMTWRRSFSILEKPYLPEGVKCVLQALEIVRNSEPDLAPLTSYHLKTVLFYTMDKECDWSGSMLVHRLLNVLDRLEMSLNNENLPHYFIREINLFSSMSQSSMRNMRDRIKHILSNDDELAIILGS